MSDTAGTKRKADEDGMTPESTESSGEPTPKKPKTSSELMIVPEQKQMQLVPAASSSTSAPTIARTSSLQAPTMLLSGHGAAVYTVEFNPGGTTLASGGADHQIYLWQVFGDCINIGVLKSHTASVLQLHWSHDGEHIYSASADKTAAVWDAETGIRTKRLREHTSYVNAITSNRKNGSKMVLTGSDDCTAMLWDLRARRPQHTFKNDYQVLAVAFNDDHTQIFTGGIDNDIKCYDLRTIRPLYSLSGHRDTVTGLSLSPDGAHILSNAMDNTLRMWDIRPYVNGDRQVGAFTGLTHTVEQNLLRCCWSPDGARVSAGSADKFVYVWDTLTKRMLYKLPGHHGSVNDVDFHPYEPILASASSDKKIFMGEL